MTKEIDWSKAPEWATGNGMLETGFGIEKIWFNESQYLPENCESGFGPYPFGGLGSEAPSNHTRNQIRFEVLRPAAWTGDGLPPVGTVCEYGITRHQVRIITHLIELQNETMAVGQVGETGPLVMGIAGYFFAIRPAEQIAADESKAELETFTQQIYRDACIEPEIAERLFAKGYWKGAPK